MGRTVRGEGEGPDSRLLGSTTARFLGREEGGLGGRGEVVLTRKLLHSGKPRAASPPLWSGSLSPIGATVY